MGGLLMPLLARYLGHHRANNDYSNFIFSEIAGKN
jgi:hypothetical protein